MLERRLRHNVVLLLLTFVIGLGLYEMIAGPGPPFHNPTSSESQIAIPPAYTPITNLSNLYTYPYHTLRTDDYTHLINLNSFKFDLLSEPCSSTNDTVLLLVLIHSAPKNFAKRKTIRETWGRSNSLMHLVFMIGTVTEQALQDKLLTENGQFGDMTQGDFVDTYRNVTYKHIMVLKYAIYHCAQARYILKTDDDVFVNIYGLLEFLANDVSFYGASGLLMCWLRNNELAIRTYRSKWRVSFDEYPDKRYPPYCPGWAVLYSQDILFLLYRAAQNSSYFWIDDVFITGMLFQSIGNAKTRYQHTDLLPYMLTKYDQNEIVYKNPNYNLKPGFIFSRPDLNETEIRRLNNFTMIYNSIQKRLR